ncbi:regulatory protein RecX [Agrococcus sp. HG114]|uniref:regulatory protein RecX n=1 Tax=Agrococcus sp. HG114 TaxID=2969757 RepID=UPI00215B1126|nr:regulatory protein RecX [Agrococcus sp. HG114]MCR8670361.1 RecX family transcriptional regulator [Agrococcus sp. HG114]
MSDLDGLAAVTELSTWIAGREERPGSRAEPSVGREQRRDRDARESGPGEPIDEEAARGIALRALGRRAASRFELDRALAKRDVEPQVRAAVLDALERDRYLDDEQLARDEAARLRERKQLGERGIAAALRQRGLDPAVLDEVDRDDELQRAIDAAAERRTRLASLDDETAERRLAGWLQRRGFGGGAVRIAIERTRPRGPRFR